MFFMGLVSIMKCRCSVPKKNKMRSRWADLLGQEMSLQDLWKEGNVGGGRKQEILWLSLKKRPLNFSWIAVRRADCPTRGAHKLASLAAMGSFGKEGMATRTSVCAEQLCSAQGFCRILGGSGFPVFCSYWWCFLAVIAHTSLIPVSSVLTFSLRLIFLKLLILKG